MSDQVEALPALIPARDVAEACNVTLRTLTNWERKGVLLPLRISGRRYYRSADLLRLQERHLWAQFSNGLNE
ncbi:MAG: MerR family transcriptional regulator [Burkholderiales bacterium]|nr:MerR family transcriptional regulator [Burkholderiales bacterium]